MALILSSRLKGLKNPKCFILFTILNVDSCCRVVMGLYFLDSINGSEISYWKF